MRRMDTLAEAQLALPFQIAVPDYLPPATWPEPEIYLAEPPADPGDAVQLLYRERHAMPGQEEGLRIFIMEAGGEFSLAKYNPEILAIRGVSIELAVAPAATEEALIMTDWITDNVAMAVSFTSLSSGSGRGSVTDEMRGEALRVIESMLSSPDPGIAS